MRWSSSPGRRCAALVAALVTAAPAHAQEPVTPAAAEAEEGEPTEVPADVPVDVPADAGENARPGAPAGESARPGAPAGSVVRLAITTPQVPDEALAEPLLEALRRGAERGGLGLLGAAEVAGLAGGACTDTACVRRLATGLGATHVLRTTATRTSRDYVLRLELVATAQEKQVTELDALCELCGLSELLDLASDQAALLAPRAIESAAPPPELLLTSQPTGARVLIDGLPAGATPLTRALVPGEHVVSLSFEGHLPEERAIRAVAGVREKLHVVLQRSPETLRVRSAGWGLLFSGIAGVLGGAVLLSIDGRPYQPRCNGTDVDPRGQCHFVYNTDIGGAAILAGGAALVTVGALLVVQTRDRERRRRRRAALGAGGLMLRF